MTDSKEGFAHRLNQAIEQHELAPPNEYGRQAWLAQKLVKEAGVSVSHNTIHKWVHGTAKPRSNSLTALARVLGVDEVWLAYGRIAGAQPNKDVAPSAANAGSAAMLLAGLIEMAGGRVTFPRPGEGGPHITVNIGSERFGCIVSAGSLDGKKVGFAVTDTVGDNRLVGIVQRERAIGSDCGITSCIDILDLTDVPRTAFGGFSAITLESRGKGKYKAEGVRSLLSAAKTPGEVVPA